MLTLASTYEPVTFTGPDDMEGIVHRYGSTTRSTACGVTLASNHGVVSPASTKPLCTDCFA